jgi:hypothetical protein
VEDNLLPHPYSKADGWPPKVSPDGFSVEVSFATISGAYGCSQDSTNVENWNRNGMVVGSVST